MTEELQAAIALAKETRGAYDTIRLAEALGVSKRTIREWRAKGTGPKFIKVGGRFRYRPLDVDAWLAAQTNKT